MMIQQQARKNLNERVQRWDPDHKDSQPIQRRPDEQVLSKIVAMNGGNKVLNRRPKKLNKIAPVQLVPTTLEEAPLRRMDRRALNALRKRRADRHMIAFLVVSGIVLILMGLAAVGTWKMFRQDHHYVGPFIILGPILAMTGVALVVSSMELIIRLRKQIKRVMDPNLLKTDNLHEVKHWVEPELIYFGWGQFNMEEEAQLLDDQKLRKVETESDRFV